jgi:hypothetical protein
MAQRGALTAVDGAVATLSTSAQGTTLRSSTASIAFDHASGSYAAAIETLIWGIRGVRQYLN